MNCCIYVCHIWNCFYIIKKELLLLFLHCRKCRQINHTRSYFHVWICVTVIYLFLFRSSPSQFVILLSLVFLKLVSGGINFTTNRTFYLNFGLLWLWSRFWFFSWPSSTVYQACVALLVSFTGKKHNGNVHITEMAIRWLSSIWCIKLSSVLQLETPVLTCWVTTLRTLSWTSAPLLTSSSTAAASSFTVLVCKENKL